MSNKNEVFEYLIDQLRQQLQVVDVMGEIKRWSIDRSIVGRGNYTDEENAIIDAYIGLEHNPNKQQCEDLAHEVQSLKNQLRDASAQIKELHLALVEATGDVGAYKLIRKGEHGPEQSGCRKEDTQECDHNWIIAPGLFIAEGHKDNVPGSRFCCECGAREWDDPGYEPKAYTQKCKHEWEYYYPNGEEHRRCAKCGVITGQSGRRKEDAQECEHDWVRDIDEEYFECRRCGVTKYGECEHDWYFYDKGASMMCKKCRLKK